MYSWCFRRFIFLFYIYTICDVVHAVRCPTNKNQPVNITRLSNRLGITWIKNTDSGGFTNAIYNSTTGGCLLPSNDANYTTYCEEYDNNKYKFTLQVHQPIEGDVYYATSGDINDKTTIIFQEPENIEVKIEPQIKDEVILTDGKTIELTSSITCTKPTPILTWIIKSQDGSIIHLNGRTTIDVKGCDLKQTTISSNITISNFILKIFNDPFTVSAQLSYRECDNIYTSQPTPYFTIKGDDDNEGVYEDRFSTGLGVGVGVGVGISVVIAGVIVGVTLIILKRKRQSPPKDTGRPREQTTNMTIFTSDVSGYTTSGVNESSSPSHYDDLNSDTRENTAPTYQHLSKDVSGSTTSGVHEPSSPSHYDDLNSETRENIAPTYQKLSVYQN